MRLRRIVLASALVLWGFAATSASGAEGAPVVRTVAPSSGPALGGTKVSIAGTGLENVTAVYFGDRKATSFDVRSDKEIRAVAPPGSGVADVTVETATDASEPDADATFSYVPVVQAVTPDDGSVSGNAEVTIAGAGFTDATAVRFGKEDAAEFEVLSEGKIVATTPPGSGRQPVTVTTRAGTSPRGPSYRYRLEIAALSPEQATPGSSLTVKGIGFAFTSTVEVGGTFAGFVVLSDTRMLVVVPPGEDGTDVVVRTPFGNVSSKHGFSRAEGGTTATASASAGGRRGEKARPVVSAGPKGQRLTLRPVYVAWRKTTASIDVSLHTTRAARLAVDVLNGQGGRVPFIRADGKTRRIVRVRARAGASIGLVLSVDRSVLHRGRSYRLRVTALDATGTRTRAVAVFTAL